MSYEACLHYAGFSWSMPQKPCSRHSAVSDSSRFRGRISVSTMAKLVLCEILPPQSTQILYLDGNTQITFQQFDQLQNANVP